MNFKDIISEVEKIAQNNLDISTLERQGSDENDFHELAVWNIKQALIEAYIAGKKQAPPE